MTINEVIAYQYAQTAEQIHSLKMQAYSATQHEKYAYVAPDGKSFRNDRPSEAMMKAGWTYAKVKFDRATSFMNPKHTLWAQYQQLRSRARRLMAAKLILKANNGQVPASKEQVMADVKAGVFQSQARTTSQQKSLAFSAYRWLVKVENKLKNQPEAFSIVQTWIAERSVTRAAA